MFRLIFISSLLFLKIDLLSQDMQLFNKTYDNEKVWEGFVGITPRKDGGYFCIGKQSGGTYQDNKATFWGLKENGDTIFKKQMFEDSIVFHFGRNPIQQTDGTTWMAGGWADIKANLNEGSLYKFSQDGDVQLFKHFAHPAWSTFDHVERTKDGNLLLCGLSQLYSLYDDVYLAKVDTLGNEIWSVVYESSGWQRAHCLVPLDDDSFVIAVNQLTDLTFHTEILIMKFDSNGNFLWEKKLGGAEDNSEWAQISLMKDGKLLFTSASMVNGIPFPYIAKVSKDGEILFEKTYTELPGGHYITPGFEKPNGNIVFAGNTYSDSTGNGYAIATMTEVEDNGSIVWYREYQFPPHTARFWSMCKSNEGGWVAAGTTLRDYQLTRQDAWAVKMDEYGNTCFKNDCDTLTTSVDLVLGTETNKLTVFPNPSNDSFQVVTTATDLKNVQICLYSITGEMVWQETFAHFPNYRTLFFDEIAKGVYVLQLQTKDGIQFTRVVVQ